MKFIGRWLIPACLGLAVAAPLMSCGKTIPSPVCSFTIAPASHAIQAEGGSRTVMIAASAASCVWSVESSARWISPPAGGTGSGSFTYVAGANDAVEPRSATLLVGGQSHSVTQAGREEEPPLPGACTFDITPQSATLEAEGGAGTFHVQTRDDCPWTAVPGETWVTIESDAQGTGSGTVRYRVDGHDGRSERVTTIAIADVTFTVRQAAFDPSVCSYLVTPVEFTPCLTAGSLTTHVQTGANCPWTVRTSAPWLTVTGDPARSGSGDLTTLFTSNYDAPRESVVMIRWPTATAGQNVRIAQAGCLYATSVGTVPVSAAGGTFSFYVLQQAVPNSCGGPLQDACVWTPTTAAAWITLSAPGPRRGDASVGFVVAPNDDSAPRAATIVVRDRAVSIEQGGKVP